MGWLQEAVYFTSQSSLTSSAAATQTCPKLSQYRSQRPPFDLSTYTKAVQASPHVTPRSTFGHLSYESQHASVGELGASVGELGASVVELGASAGELGASVGGLG